MAGSLREKLGEQVPRKAIRSIAAPFLRFTDKQATNSMISWIRKRILRISMNRNTKRQPNDLSSNTCLSQNGLRKTNQDLSSFHLKNLPPELRILIFEHSLRLDAKDSKLYFTTPIGERRILAQPLLAALRKSPHIYNEAFNVLYRINTFKLHPSNLYSFRQQPLELIRSIRNLTIEFGRVNNGHENGFQDFMVRPSSRMGLLTGLVVLEFGLAEEGQDGCILRCLRAHINCWRRLRRLVVSLHDHRIGDSGAYMDSGMIPGRIDKMLGRRGMRDIGGEICSVKSCIEEKWVWEAGCRNVLIWSDDWWRD